MLVNPGGLRGGGGGGSVKFSSPGLGGGGPGDGGFGPGGFGPGGFGEGAAGGSGGGLGCGLGGGGEGFGGGGDLGGGGLGFGGGDAFGTAAPALSTKSSAHKSTLSITRGAMRCAQHVSDCPCNSSARRRTFTDTLQPRERPAERTTSAPLQDRRGTGPSTLPPAQLATTLLRPLRRQAAGAQPAQIAPVSAPRCAASTGHRAGATRGGAGRAARRASPCPPCRAHLHTGPPAQAEGALEERASVRLRC